MTVAQTSIWSIRQLSREGELNRREFQLLNALKRLGVASDRELAHYLEWEIGSVNGRRNSLVKKEKVIEAYKARGKTGRTVTFWKPYYAV